MLKAARAQGKPMSVTTMMSAAIAQPTAIHRPPNRIQSRLRRIDSTDTRASKRRHQATAGLNDLPYVITIRAVCQAGVWGFGVRLRDCRANLGVRPVQRLDAQFHNENCLQLIDRVGL